MEAWQEIWNRHREKEPGIATRLGLDQEALRQPGTGTGSRQAFAELLRRRHGYSPV